MQIERVHNLLEAKVLIKQAYSYGEEDKYNNCKFQTHDGEFLFTCKTDWVQFEMEFTTHSTFIEV